MFFTMIFLIIKTDSVSWSLLLLKKDVQHVVLLKEITLNNI